jgi:hypothetical protein
LSASSEGFSVPELVTGNGPPTAAHPRGAGAGSLPAWMIVPALLIRYGTLLPLSHDAGVPSGTDQALAPDDDQKRREGSCFLAKEQSCGTACRARALLSRTRTGTGQSCAGVSPST